MLDKPFASGSFEFHAKLVIAQEAVRWIFCENPDQCVAGRLSNLRHDKVGRGERSMNVSRDQFFDTGCFERHVPSDGMIKGAAKTVHV